MCHNLVKIASLLRPLAFLLGGHFSPFVSVSSGNQLTSEQREVLQAEQEVWKSQQDVEDMKVIKACMWSTD